MDQFDTPVDHDHLVNFLARLKMKMEDANMSTEDLREYLLASDLGIMPGEHFASLDEVVEVLQTDLLLPVTDDDQLVLLKQVCVLLF
jgi:hypothetical protein